MAKCKECGFHIRSKDHAEGVHHKTKKRPLLRKQSKRASQSKPES